MPIVDRRIPLSSFLGALTGAFAVVHFGLQTYVMTDYEIEALPAMQRLMNGDWWGYLERLPGYGGALLMESPFVVFGPALGPDPIGVWRALSIPGLLFFLVIGALLGRSVGYRLRGTAGIFWAAATAALVAGSPIAILAQQTGHPEELLTVGLMLVAVLVGMQGQAISAGLLAGLAAAGKPSALIAVPVVLVATADRGQALRMLTACVVAGTLLMTPIWAGSTGVQTSTTASASATGIFRPSNVFWFLGSANPNWSAVQRTPVRLAQEPDPTNAAWAQRLEPEWVGRVTHPLIVLFALGLALAFWRRRDAQERRGDDLLLLLATVGWARCLLDTWNVHYYALGSVIALAAWEARRGRPPLLAGIVTALVWMTLRPWTLGGMPPDHQALLYLGWAVPLGVGMLWRLLAPDSAIRAADAVTRPIVLWLPTLARIAGLGQAQTRVERPIGPAPSSSCDSPHPQVG